MIALWTSHCLIAMTMYERCTQIRLTCTWAAYQDTHLYELIFMSGFSQSLLLCMQSLGLYGAIDIESAVFVAITPACTEVVAVNTLTLLLLI